MGKINRFHYSRDVPRTFLVSIRRRRSQSARQIIVLRPIYSITLPPPAPRDYARDSGIYDADEADFIFHPQPRGITLGTLGENEKLATAHELPPPAPRDYARDFEERTDVPDELRSSTPSPAGLR